MDNICVLQAMIDRQKQLRLQGVGSGKQLALWSLGKRAILYHVFCCGRCWKSWESTAEYCTSSSAYAPMTAQHSILQRASQRFSDAYLESSKAAHRLQTDHTDPGMLVGTLSLHRNAIITEVLAAGALCFNINHLGLAVIDIKLTSMTKACQSV